MPLTPGSPVSSTIKELHSGKTYAHTAAKFGKKDADKQAIAIALSNARKAPNRAMGGMMPPPPPGMMMNGPGASPVGLAPPPVGVPQNMPNMGAMGSLGPAKAVPNGVAGFAPRQMNRGGVPNRAMGGFNMAQGPNLMPTWQERQEARGLTRGPILSAVPGRTDAHATHVPSGSYVIPADVVSGRGQGNTIAGANSLQKLFRMGPYGTGGSSITHGAGAPGIRPPKLMMHSGGGKSNGHIGTPVRVNLAGGEVVVPPENLMAVVHPNLKHAHGIMDAWVLQERKKLRKTLAKLPGPVKS